MSTSNYTICLYIYTHIHIGNKMKFDNTYKMCVMFPQLSSGLIIISVSLGNFIINLVAAAINLQKNEYCIPSNVVIKQHTK